VPAAVSAEVAAAGELGALACALASTVLEDEPGAAVDEDDEEEDDEDDACAPVVALPVVLPEAVAPALGLAPVPEAVPVAWIVSPRAEPTRVDVDESLDEEDE
jgi:hypothetical protein